jgi:tetratricopeptide (TPR) repeat protein
VHSRLGNLDQALADYNQALRLNPRNGFHVYSRADLCANMKQYSQAIADFEESIRVGGGWCSQPDLVWLLATCPDEKHRNGKQAVELAEDGQFERKELEWECLAAAYAEVGQFDKAVEWQKKALDAGGPYLRRGGREKAAQRLKLYQQGKPYREES